MDDLTYLFKMANMNEAVISNEEKPIVGTQALATCFGLLLYDENNKTHSKLILPIRKEFSFIVYNKY